MFESPTDESSSRINIKPSRFGWYLMVRGLRVFGTRLRRVNVAPSSKDMKIWGRLACANISWEVWKRMEPGGNFRYSQIMHTYMYIGVQ